MRPTNSTADIKIIVAFAALAVMLIHADKISSTTLVKWRNHQLTFIMCASK